MNAMLAWKINAVRVTINEDCWLGINGLPADGNPAGYRQPCWVHPALAEPTACT